LDGRGETDGANGSKFHQYAATHFFNRKNNTGNTNQIAREDADTTVEEQSRARTPGRCAVMEIREIIQCVRWEAIAHRE
jgi:hypothetical protein